MASPPPPPPPGSYDPPPLPLPRLSQRRGSNLALELVEGAPLARQQPTPLRTPEPPPLPVSVTPVVPPPQERDRPWLQNISSGCPICSRT